jgi:glycosyltransferase involved in cell wall biosynthesis
VRIVASVRTLRVIGNVEPGGGQLSALRLGAALERRGYSVRFAAGSATEDGIELFRSHGFELELYGVRRNLQYVPDSRFADWLAPRLEEVDLVHAHQFGAWWAAARAAPPHVVVVGSEHNAYQWPTGVAPIGIRAALRRLDALFVHGPAARRQLLALGAPPGLLREGRSAIDDITPAEPRAPLRHPPGERLVYAGRLHEEKGPDLLLEALALMPAPPFAQLIGSGPLETSLRERARALGLERAVTFPGWQARPADWIAGASACVVPSRFDAWSQTAVLAMALRVPVVGFAVDGLAEVLADGRGIAVAPESPAGLARAFTGLLAGEAHAGLDAAQRYAACFTSDNVADVYERSYLELGIGAARLSGRYAKGPGDELNRNVGAA